MPDLVTSGTVTPRTCAIYPNVAKTVNPAKRLKIVSEMQMIRLSLTTS
jgi:hypothetical protein